MRPLLLLILFASSALAANKAPVPSLRKAFEANQHSVVKVQGGAKKKSGPGVIVSSEGHVITSVDYVALDTAVLTVGAEEIPADVLVADASMKIAVIKPRAGSYAASAVNTQTPVQRDDWLVAISRKKDGSLQPKAGQVLKLSSGKSPFFETDIFLPAGTPLYDRKGRLVAVLVSSKGRALPVGLVKARIAEAHKLLSQDAAP